ncbi:9398_t:CDS:2 [Funneliformis geosporum]|nr:9398_t:CDS:2 [Funneliformis geosporum]
MALISKDALLQQKYQEHQEHSNKFRFDPSKHVSDIIDRIKKAIEKSLNKPRGGDPRGDGDGSRRNRGGSTGDDNDPFGGLGGDGSLPDGSGSNRTPRPRKSNQAETSPPSLRGGLLLMTNQNLEQAKNKLGEQTQKLENKAQEL